MRTLGASNPHNNNKDKHRANTRFTLLILPSIKLMFHSSGLLETLLSVCLHQATRALITRFSLTLINKINLSIEQIEILSPT